MIKIKIFKSSFSFLEIQDILEYILKLKNNKLQYTQIISINPENIVLTKSNQRFANVVKSSQSHIVDGVGVQTAIRLLKKQSVAKLSGVDLMESMLSIAQKERLRVLLIGGKKNLANNVRECYLKKYPTLKIWSTQGFFDVLEPSRCEERELKSIVAFVKPHLVFVAFGSPNQEIWLDNNKELFPNSLVMGVGGGFAFLANSIKRAPIFIRNLGLEWLYRLLIEPWRLIRQLRLLSFIRLVIQELLFP